GHQLDRGRHQVAEIGMGRVGGDDAVVEVLFAGWSGGDQCGAHHLVPGRDAEGCSHVHLPSSGWFRGGRPSRMERTRTLSQPVMRTLQIVATDVKITGECGRVENATLAEPGLERWHSHI